MKLQILVSSMNKDAQALAVEMKLPAESIIINQGSENRYEEFEYNGNRMRCYHLAERGVGLSRNNALLRADGDICLFSDEDIVYRNGADRMVLEAFEAHPEADMLLFNVEVTQSRRTYWTEKFHRVRWYNCGRYPAYSFALRTDKMHGGNLTYSLYFGGGAKYSNGEDSLFISDCLKAGLRIYAVPVVIGEEVPRPSTWFSGFTEKFFYDRGVLYHVLYGVLALPMGLRFLLKNKAQMCGKDGKPFREALTLLKKGIRDVKKGL